MVWETESFPRLDGCMFGRLTRELRTIGLLGPGYSEVPSATACQPSTLPTYLDVPDRKLGSKVSKSTIYQLPGTSNVAMVSPRKSQPYYVR